MPPLFASLESILVFVAIVLISALSNWVKQRQERKKQGDLDSAPDAEGRPRPLFPPILTRRGDETGEPPSKPLDWQEELRRLLEGERPEPPPPPPPPPAARPGVPPPLAPSRPQPLLEEEPPFRPAPVLRTTVVTTSDVALDSLDAPSFELASFSRSDNAYERASQLREIAEARLRAAVNRVETATPVRTRVNRRGNTARASQLTRQLHNPLTAQQAILAAVVLGRPRGLESHIDAHG